MIIRVKQLPGGRWYWVAQQPNSVYMYKSYHAYADASLANYAAQRHKEALRKLGVMAEINIVNGTYDVPHRDQSRRRTYGYIDTIKTNHGFTIVKGKQNERMGSKR